MCLRAFWGKSWVVFELSSGVFGASWGFLGAAQDDLGQNCSLGLSRGSFTCNIKDRRASWGDFELSSGGFGAAWGFLGAAEDDLDQNCAPNKHMVKLHESAPKRLGTPEVRLSRGGFYV